MLKRAFSFLMITLFLISSVTAAFTIQKARAASETIIDTHGDSRFTKYPSGPYWWSVSDHDVFHTRAYNNNFWYTYCGDAAHGDAYYGEWQVSLPQSGEYDVFAWIPNPDAFGTYTPTQSAGYMIWYQGAMTIVTVNQRLRTGGWYSLGRFTFGTSATIRLNDRTGEPYLSTMIAFDAVKFTSVAAPPCTLSVYSAHDNPVPSNGAHSYNSGQSVTCSVSSPVFEGSTRWDCTGWSGTGSVPSVGYSSSTGYFNIYQDSSITWTWQSSSVQRTLTVSSAHDSPNPSSGPHTYDVGQSVTCSVTSPVTEGSTVWTCTGWSGAGSVPSSGSSTSVTFTITLASSITWNWIVTPPAPDFSISASPFPSPLSIPAGGSGKWILTITSISGFSVPVQLDVSSLYGVQLSCPTEAQPPPDGSITVDLDASVYLWAPPGIYELTVTGTFGVLTPHILHLLLNIEPPSPPEISSWKVTNLYETSTLHGFLGHMESLLGYTIDCDFDVFVTDYQRVKKVEITVPSLELTSIDLVEVEPGHYMAHLGIRQWPSQNDVLLNALEQISNFLPQGDPQFPGLPKWYKEPTLPYAAVTDITIIDTSINVYHITQSKIGQALPERLPNYQDAINAKAPDWVKPGGTLFRGDCAVDFLATDALGRRVGALYQNGQFVGAVNEIPNAFYSGQDPDLQVIFIPLQFENCTVQTTGRNSGTYALGVLTFQEQDSERFVAIDIPSSMSAVHNYTISWDALSLGEEGVTVEVDSDGNGVSEYTFTSDSGLTQNEFLIRTGQIALYTFSIVWGEETFIVSAESNSTVGNFAFSQPGKAIGFDVSGSADTTGFCNVTIPKALLYAAPSDWIVLVDDALPLFTTIAENATHSCVYFTYTHSAHTIQIVGTWVIEPPKDTNPPLIETPFQEPDKVNPDQAVTVYVNVTDMESGVESVVLFYTTNGGVTWNDLTMLCNATTALYQAVIPAFPSGTSICYKVIAYDNAGNFATNDNAGQYYCYTVNRTHAPGDVNGDGIVDVKDVYIVAAAYGESPERPRWNPNADANGDGKVDIKDLYIVCKNYGKTY